MASDKADNGTRLNGSEMIVRSLTSLGVEVIFGYPGGAVLPIYDALFKQNNIRHIFHSRSSSCLSRVTCSRLDK